MVHRHRARGTLAAALLAILVALAAAGVVAAAGPVTMDARALVAGRFESGGWLAVAVGLTNEGAPVEGHVAAETSDGEVRRAVELPAGARKQVVLYLRPEPFQRAVTVRFEADGEQLAAAEIEVRSLERGTGHVAVVGDGGGNLRPQLAARAQGGLPEPIALAPGDIPERPEPLHGIEAIVWAADSTVLSEAQRRAVERWIAGGGQLLVVGGPDWQARTAAFDDLLPVEGIVAVDGVDAAPLAAWVGVAPPSEATGTAALGAPREGALGLAPLDDESDRHLLSVIPRGAGRVGYLGVDVASPGFRAWEGSPLLWSRLIPDNRIAEHFGGGFPIEEEAANSMIQALSNLPSLEVPPPELLLGVIVGYILLIGPVSYVVLRRLDRRELAWVTAPVLVVLFSACSYGIGASMKGSAVILNEISLVRSSTGGGAASVQTYAGLFSPDRATYDLTVRSDALIAPLAAPAFQPVPNAPEVSYLTEQGDPAHLRGLDVSVFGFESIRADAVVAHRPALEVEWRLNDDGLVGTVRNAGEVALEDVAVVSASGGVMIGELEPGASEEFTLPLQNFNGSSAADQVYGFMNFDPTTSTPEQRRNLVRRQVIDALVGYGGWWPGKATELTVGSDRGPFVIGWQTSPGPVPIEVDGVSVQHYSQTVEVVSGRPILGPGEVQVEPAHMSVELVSSDGAASTGDPGFVTLGNGEVVFSIALPLEAATLQPTAVTILVGTDPSMIAAPQENFGAVLPPGYSLSLRDPRSGEWLELGDLSVDSRFRIDDPASALDAAGRIEVRISGAGVPDNFGQTPVFVGASVEGVIE